MKNYVLKQIRKQYHIKIDVDPVFGKRYMYMEKNGLNSGIKSSFIEFIKPLLTFMSVKEHLTTIDNYTKKKDYKRIKKYFK